MGWDPGTPTQHCTCCNFIQFLHLSNCVSCPICEIAQHNPVVLRCEKISSEGSLGYIVARANAHVFSQEVLPKSGLHISALRRLVYVGSSRFSEHISAREVSL